MSRVIQGFFPGGQPRIVQPSPRQPVQPAPRPTPVRPLAANAFTLPANFRMGLPGTGQSLPREVQLKMETVFGTDFSGVRVHVGGEAAAIGALAFTCGNDLYFAPGQYDPQTVRGQRLLGHELTHVVQQRTGRARNPLGAGVAVLYDPHLEAEAERMGMRASMAAPGRPMQAKPARVVLPQRAAIQRKSWTPAPPGRGGVVQPDYNLVRVSYQEGQANRNTDWAVSDSLDVTITLSGERYRVPAAGIHTQAMSTADQQLIAAISIIHNSPSGFQMTTTRLAKVYSPHAFHTEPALLLDIAKTVVTLLVVASLRAMPILGLIIEIRQSNSPCASCQKVMSLFAEKMHNQFNIPIIIRASAMQIYESAPGPIGTELHRQTVAHTNGFRSQGLPDMSEITGLHRTI